MRNNHRIMMIAWIMAAIMILCSLPMSALAVGDSYTNTGTLAKFIINNLMDYTDVIKTTDGKVVENVSTADRSQDYYIYLSVIETQGVHIPDKGNFYYNLPDEVESAEDGSNLQVTWKYDAQNRQLVFSWAGNNLSSFDANVKIKLGGVYDLYNIAKIDNTYYRLAKTKIRTEKKLSSVLGTYMNASDYSMDPYDFENLTITINGFDYYYDCDANRDLINATGRYYTAKFDNLNVVAQKIGGMNGKTPRWLVPEDQQYDDPNETDSFHANYTIVIHSDPYEQDLINMVKIDRGNNYYRLKMSKIIARDPREFKNAQIIPEKNITFITNEEYDFTNVVLYIDDDVYVYRKTAPETAEYTSYYTIRYENIVKQNRINGDAEWYKNPLGWLDGSYNEYKNVPNEIEAYHRDYVATLYKGTIPTYRIEIRNGNDIAMIQSTEGSTPELPVPETTKGYEFVGWNTEEDGTGTEYNAENKLTVTEDTVLYPQWNEAGYLGVELHSNLEDETEVYEGTEVILTATPIGFYENDVNFSIQWEYETPEGVRVPIDEDTLVHTFNINAENSQYRYHITLTPIE